MRLQGAGRPLVAGGLEGARRTARRPAPAPLGRAREQLDRHDEGAMGVLADCSAPGSRSWSCARTSHADVRCSSAAGPGAVRAAADHGGLGALRESRRPLEVLQSGAVGLADHPDCRSPGYAERFEHVVLLDPPPFRELREALDRSAPAAGEGFLHLAWGPAELELTRKIIEHEYSLRPSLAAIYRALVAAGGSLSGEQFEAAASGEGSHPRGPALCGRCLRVLDELDARRQSIAQALPLNAR